MEIQNDNPSWYDQVKDKYISHSSNTNVGKTNISNSLVSGNNLKEKQHRINEVLVLNNTLPHHEVGITNSQYSRNILKF